MEIVNIYSFLLFDKCAFISVMNYRGFPLVILKQFKWILGVFYKATRTIQEW